MFDRARPRPIDNVFVRPSTDPYRQPPTYFNNSAPESPAGLASSLFRSATPNRIPPTPFPPHDDHAPRSALTYPNFDPSKAYRRSVPDMRSSWTEPAPFTQHTADFYPLPHAEPASTLAADRTMRSRYTSLEPTPTHFYRPDPIVESPTIMRQDPSRRFDPVAEAYRDAEVLVRRMERDGTPPVRRYRAGVDTVGWPGEKPAAAPASGPLQNRLRGGIRRSHSPNILQTAPPAHSRPNEQSLSPERLPPAASTPLAVSRESTPLRKVIPRQFSPPVKTPPLLKLPAELKARLDQEPAIITQLEDGERTPMSTGTKDSRSMISSHTPSRLRSSSAGNPAKVAPIPATAAALRRGSPSPIPTLRKSISPSPVVISNLRKGTNPVMPVRRAQPLDPKAAKPTAKATATPVARSVTPMYPSKLAASKQPVKEPGTPTNAPSASLRSRSVPKDAKLAKPAPPRVFLLAKRAISLTSKPGSIAVKTKSPTHGSPVTPTHSDPSDTVAVVAAKPPATVPAQPSGATIVVQELPVAVSLSSQFELPSLPTDHAQLSTAESTALADPQPMVTSPITVQFDMSAQGVLNMDNLKERSSSEPNGFIDTKALDRMSLVGSESDLTDADLDDYNLCSWPTTPPNGRPSFVPYLPLAAHIH